MRNTGSSALASAPRFPTRLHSAQTELVGRKGAIALEYVRQGGRTVFGRTSCRTPWHLLPPIYLDDSGSAYTLLVNPSGGLVGGDHLSIDVSIGPKAHVLISTPSANRVYRSPSREAVQDVTINVAGEGILEWIPEHTIPFAGSRFRQSLDVRLGAGATLVLWDAVASGRIAHGERWGFSSLENRIKITMPGHSTVQEHYALALQSSGNIGLMREWDYLGSFFVAGDALAGPLRDSLETTLADILDRHGDREVLGGVSQPAAPGVVVKLVAKSAPVMTQVFIELWAAVREALWRMPAVSLRKY